MTNIRRRALRSREGFTLIELLVVVLIIGILAAIAVPQYFRVVERGRATEAIHWVHSIKGAEERAMLKTGAYVVTGSLDIQPAALQAYTNSAVTPTGATSWVVTLTRNAAVPTYGAYIITFNSSAATPFTCNNATAQADLMP